MCIERSLSEPSDGFEVCLLFIHPRAPNLISLQSAETIVTRKKEDRVLTGRQPWELRSCELVFASVEVLHSVAAGPPTQ